MGGHGRPPTGRGSGSEGRALERGKSGEEGGGLVEIEDGW